MKRKELLREDIIKEKVKGGDCKTMPDKLYNILYEKSKVYGVRVLYEEDFPLDELTEFIQQELDRAREEGINEALKEMNGTLNTNCSFNYNISTCCQLNSYFYYFLCYI